MTRDGWRGFAPHVLMLASGFAGLGYQIVWTAECSLWLGHESAAVLAVVTAFFGGLAAGGLVFGTRIEQSARPLRWYAGAELVVALWSALVLVLGTRLQGVVEALTGVEPSPLRQWSVAFGAAFLAFLPATAAMGASLPAMERLKLGRSARSIAHLYASNTLGAVLGVLACAFWLIPAFGLTQSGLVCVALNLVAALGASFVFGGSTPPHVASTEPRETDPLASRRALVRLAATGFLGIGYEVLVVRVASQVTEDTVYTFALLLAVYLAGTAAGAAAYRRFFDARGDRDALGDRLLAALSVACLAGAASLWAAESIRAWAADAFGRTFAGALASEAVLALVSFGPATVAMGALFSHLCRSAHAAGATFGRAFGVNTLAAAAAPVLFGVVALPALGAKALAAVVAGGYLALVRRGTWWTRVVLLPAAGLLLLLFFAPPLTFIDVPAGGHVESYAEGVMAAVSVVADADGVRRLRIDDREQEGSSATRYVDARQAWLPLLLHPKPARALFLGLGTGVTAASAADDPTLAVDAVELLPEVIAASKYFAREPSDFAPPRLHAIAADARRYVHASERRYDLIVSDNFHPARSGSGALYTVEHFAAVRRRLAADGVFCQWLPLHQLDLDTLRSIVRSFASVFPRAFALLANNSLETPVIGLVGREHERGFEQGALEARLAHVALPRDVAELGLDDELAVLGSFVAGPRALARFSSSAEPNTDDRPVVAYRAPRVTYAPDSSPAERLSALLAELSLDPDELFDGAPNAAFRARVAAYLEARNRFIASGRDVHPSPRVDEMLAQVREPLLAVLRISPDFRPAYDPLLSMARALARSDRDGARTLLAELSRIQPARTEASRLLAFMTSGPAASSAVSP